MALLGASIDPSLFKQDYSGFVNAANTNANAIAGLGQNLANIYKDKQKENKAMEGEIKAADTIAGILESKMPDAFPGISDLRMQMNDGNMSLVDRYNLANSIKSALSTGVQVQQLGLQQQKFDIAHSQAGQSAAGGGANPKEVSTLN